MKQGSSILYLIGNIINAIGIVLMVIFGLKTASVVHS